MSDAMATFGTLDGDLRLRAAATRACGAAAFGTLKTTRPLDERRARPCSGTSCIRVCSAGVLRRGAVNEDNAPQTRQLVRFPILL